MPIRKGRGLKVSVGRRGRVGEEAGSGTEKAGKPVDGLSEAEPEGGLGTDADADTLSRAASEATRSTMLAVNGRAGRRVACVLGGDGIELETLDLEGEEDVEE